MLVHALAGSVSGNDASQMMTLEEIKRECERLSKWAHLAIVRPSDCQNAGYLRSPRSRASRTYAASSSGDWLN